MTDLVTWLRQQIDADEAAARAAEGDGHWECTSTAVLSLGGIDDLDGFVLGPRDAIYHMELHDPARVLAEVAAKRAILDLHTKAGAGAGAFDLPDVCRPVSRGIGAVAPWPCQTLRLLALPYSSNPGFDESWRPA